MLGPMRWPRFLSHLPTTSEVTRGLVAGTPRGSFGSYGETPALQSQQYLGCRGYNIANTLAASIAGVDHKRQPDEPVSCIKCKTCQVSMHAS